MPETKNTAASILNVIAQINPMIGAAVGILNTVRAIRDAAKAANITNEYGTLPTDAELIQMFLTESGMLKAEAKEFREWLARLS